MNVNQFRFIIDNSFCFVQSLTLKHRTMHKYTKYAGDDLSVSFGGVGASDRWQRQTWSLPKYSFSKTKSEIDVTVSRCDVILHMIEILRS